MMEVVPLMESTIEVVETISEYKKQLCQAFRNGLCGSGPECNFAHGVRELRSKDNPIYKTQSCTAYDQEGRCKMGIDCLFAHGDEELRSLELDLPGDRKTVPPPATTAQDNLPKPRSQTACFYFEKYGHCLKADECRFTHDPLHASPSPTPLREKIEPGDPRYKTRLCMLFMKSQNCPNGDKCSFAHGDADLKGDKIPSKNESLFKTTLCKNFQSSGLCSGGIICNFAHGRYELRPIGFAGDFEATIKANPNWKCTLCSYFLKESRCPRQDCSFAHGERELRIARKPTPGKRPNESTMYKTSMCKELLRTGSCRYGQSCYFAHLESELLAHDEKMKGHVGGFIDNSFDPSSAGPTGQGQGHYNGGQDWSTMGAPHKGGLEHQNMGGLIQQQAQQPRKRLLITTPSLMHLDNSSSSVVDAAQAESNIDPGVDESKLFAEFLEFKKFKRQTLSEHSVNEVTGAATASKLSAAAQMPSMRMTSYGAPTSEHSSSRQQQQLTTIPPPPPPLPVSNCATAAANAYYEVPAAPCVPQQSMAAHNAGGYGTMIMPLATSALTGETEIYQYAYPPPDRYVAANPAASAINKYPHLKA